jgi:hypothetical protein
MITLMKVKELLQNQSMSDEEAGKIRDACYCMAELVFEAWNVDPSERRGGHAQTQTARAVALDSSNERMVP